MVDRSHESILIAEQGRAVRVRTIRRRPLAERWNLQAIEAVKATPRYPVPGSEDAEPKVQHTGEEQQEEVRQEGEATRGEDVLPSMRVQDDATDGYLLCCNEPQDQSKESLFLGSSAHFHWIKRLRDLM